MLRLHADLKVVASDYPIEELPGEFGRLRLPVSDRYDTEGEVDGEFAGVADALVAAPVLASQKTCENCGADGHPWLRSDQHQHLDPCPAR